MTEQDKRDAAQQSMADGEYSALMCLLGVSVSKHLLDEYLTCVWANDCFYDLIGYSESEFESRFHHRGAEYFSNNPEGMRILMEEIENAVRLGMKRTSVCVPLLSTEGEPFWVKVQIAFTDEQIDGCRVISTTMTDVTELMQARHEQEKTRKILEYMIHEQEMLMSILKVSVSKHIIDEHYTCVRANEYYYQLIGYPKEKYEAMFHNHPDEYYANNPEGWKMLTDKVTEVLERGEDRYEIIAPMKYEDGTSFWVKLFSYFTDEYIDGYRSTYTVMTDVTELVQMKNEQEMLMQSMKVSVSRHLVDEHFTVIWANDFYYDLIGYPKAEYEALFHNHCDEYFRQDEKSWERIHAKIEEMKSSGERSYEIFLALAIPDGSTRWVKMVGFFTDEYQDGKQLAYTTMVDVTDVTELRELKRQLEERTELLNAALMEAKRANEAKSDFLSRMSHDIRTPMNAILGMTTIAASHVGDPERITDCLGKINVSSKLLLSLINEVLDMSKIESGRIVLSEEEVNLAELVQGVITMVQPQINQKKLVFKTYINNISHEMVISDMQRLQQLLLNLLSNAVKYTYEGGNILLELNEKTSGAAGMAVYEFQISDSGIGMKPEFLNRVFEPFERADDEEIQSVQGTGLGLSICKRVAEMMDGTIEVESTYGKGSRFTVTICLKVGEDVIEDSALSGLTILIVDDDEIVCRNACGRLEDLGVRAEWVTNGAAALAKVEQARAAGEDYFAVILDYRMPGMDGIETTRRIREKVGNALPIIMISAYDLSEQIDDAKQAGANGFITKPLFKNRLAYKLKQFLDGGSNEPEYRPPLQGSYEGKRILLVEDNALNREIAEELLSSIGATVETAENGKAAVDRVEEAEPGTYDLIFMDMQMPIMDGCTASERIRALPREDVKTLPIIAMTANAFADDRQKTRDAGMNGHLAKPVDLEQLQQVLERWLQD